MLHIMVTSIFAPVTENLNLVLGIQASSEKTRPQEHTREKEPRLSKGIFRVGQHVCQDTMCIFILIFVNSSFDHIFYPLKTLST